MAMSVREALARVVDLFGPQASWDPTQLYGNLMVSANGNILMGSVTDDAANKLQVTGSAKITTNLNFSGTGNRITGDYSNATVASRVMFQTSTANANTSVGAIPNGTGNSSVLYAMNASTPNTAAYLALGTTASASYLNSSEVGGSTILPLQFMINGVNAWQVNTAYQFSYQGTNITGSFGSALLNMNTTTNTARLGIQGHANNQGYGIILINGSEQSVAANAIVFANSSVAQVGGITCTTSATAYNTTSDYRLKENVKPLRNALYRIMRTRVVTYTFIADDNKDVHDGFLAHELQETLPRAVHGEKDATHIHEEEERITPQMVDHSKAVPLLWAGTQELNTQLQEERRKRKALEQRLEELEARFLKAGI